MDLKTFLNYPFKDWMKPVLFSLLAFPVFILSNYIGSGMLQIIGMFLFFIAMLWLLLSAIALLFKKEWGKSFYTLLIILAIITSFALLP